MKDKYQNTLVIIKPDALQRNLLGEILHRFERKGLQVKGLKMVSLGDTLIEEHYGHHKDKDFFPPLKKFMQSSPVVLVVLAGINAISAVRLIVGPTNGAVADAGSIRGDFSLSIQSNIVHASDSEETALTEIKRFFTPEELFDYVKIDENYIYAEESFKD